MNITQPPAGFVLNGSAPQAPPQQQTVAPSAPPTGFVMDRTADAAPLAPDQNPFSENSLKADVHATERWTQFGSGVLASPQKAQAEAYATAKGVPLTPQVAGDWFKSTLPPEKQQELDGQAKGEYQVIQLVNSRDQLASQAAKQFKQAHPEADDQAMYRYVHQNLLQAGKDNSKLPAFTIDPKTLDASTDVGLIHGLTNRSVAALLAFPQATAEAGGRLIQQGVYDASKPFYDANANPYQEAVRKQNEGIGRFNQSLDSNLQGSTFGKEHPLYGMVEEGVAQVPSLLVLSGLGKAGTLGKVAEWGQVAGTEFNKAYEHVYQDGLHQGLSVGDAADKATTAGAIDAAINTYLMTKGTLGQEGGAGLRGRLRAALTGALPQGGVAGGQELVRQLSSYALTGKDANLEKVMENAASGTITGVVAGGALGHPGTDHPATEAVTKAAGDNVVPAPAAEKLAEVKTAPSEPVQIPKLVEQTTAKFRKQVDGQTASVNLDFASPEEKSLYIATEPRQGKRSKVAREHLAALGYDEDGINAYGEELRGRVNDAAVQHTGGDVLHIPASTPDETLGAKQSSDVNNGASQAKVEAPVTAAVAPTSTEAGQADSSYLPSRNRDTVAAIADATRDIPDFQREAPQNKDQAQAADAFRKHGVELVFYSGKGRGVRLSRHDGVLFINRKNVDSDLHEAVSHEFMHELKANRPALFGEFLNAMPKEMVDSARAKYQADFARLHQGETITPAKLDEEAVTYSFGQLVKENPRVWQAAIGKKAGLGTKIMDAVRAFTAKFVGGKTGQQARLVQRALKTFEATLAIPVGESQPREVREADAASYLPDGNDEVRRQAEDYTKSAGLRYTPDNSYAHVDVERAKRIAAAYDVAKHSPDDPKVKASYDAFKKETLAQYDYLKKQGVKFEAFGNDSQPYKSSKEMLADVRDNKHLGFFQGGDMPSDHPLAEKVPGSDLSYNDVFRAVHDYFGHAKEGFGFGPRGEENAWRSHSQMYSDVAKGAMTAETRGQNSWVNFGPHGEHNQANPTETKYAEQKAAILPPEHSSVETPSAGVAKLDEVIAAMQKEVGAYKAGEKPAGSALENIDKVIGGLKEMTGQDKSYLPDYKPRSEENKNSLEEIKTYLHPSEYESLSTPEVKRAVNLFGNEPAADYLPGEKFIEDDVKPIIKGAGEAVSSAWDGVKSILAPYTRSAQASTTRGILRERGSDLAQRWDRLGAAFKESKDAMDKLPQGVTRDFIDKVEKGLPQTDPALQPIADALRGVLDDRLTQVQKLGTGKLKDFVENYFPHLWQDPKKAATAYSELMAKRPIEGGKKFLKQRSHELFSDGIAAGLEPVTENPVEAMMLRVREMDKYITAQQSFAEMRSKGLLAKVKAKDVGAWQAKGYSKINDNIATVFAKPSRRGAVQIAGYHMAPEPVANVINNFLSPGLRSDPKFGKAFRGYVGASNLMNAVQLGLSGFHLAFTVMDSGISKLALGIEQAAAGQWKNAGKSVALTSTLVGPAIENFKRGNQMMQEWYHPGTTTPDIAAVVQAMKAAGGRAKMDDFYRTDMGGKMMEAFRKGNFIGGVMRAPLAGIEATSKPILESLVPRIKMGAFMDMAQHEMANNPGMSHDELRDVMGKSWDSVDNRLGEMVYDNLFWNKAAKDLAMASVRSVGWNLGTFRELGGGIKDFGNAGFDLATGKGAKFTHRMAYTLAMPVFTGVVGGVINRMLTGEGPKELKDYFFPRTGQKDKDGHDVRLSLPTYMKDVFAYGTDIHTAATEGKPLALLNTLKHKTHPMLNTILEMLSNEDYYGTKIRNEDDSYVRQLIDTAEHGAKTLVPFGIREVMKLTSEGQGARSILPLVGVTQARKDITNSAAELKASAILSDKAPKGGRTRDAADKASLVNDLSERIRNKEPGARNDLATALKAGILTESDMEKVKTNIRFQGLERSMQHLDIDEAMKVWDVASDDEKRRLGPAVFAKLRASKSLHREQRVSYLKTLQTDWTAVKGKK